MKLWPFSRSEKAASTIIHGGGGSPMFFLRNLDLRGGDGIDFGAKVGTGLGSSVVMGPVQWVQRAMVEAPLVVEKMTAEDEWEIDPTHPLTLLLDSPNDFYAGSHLWAGTVFSYLIAGNAYWMIIQNGRGEPVQLWYVPHWMIEPVGSKDGTVFIDHYVYRVEGKEFTIPVECIVHFRHGVNPNRPQLGISPLDSALREIWTDMEAADFIANLLSNSGVPGLIISPDSDSVQISPDMADEVKDYVRERTTGGNRGDPLVMSGKTSVSQMAWNPEQLNLTAASDRSEERVCALLGIPAAVVGFSAGLETTKVGATMDVMRELAWTNGVIPLQKNFGDTVQRKLLPQFGDPINTRLRFDLTEVKALQEDINKIYDRADKSIAAGWITVATAKRMVNIEPEEADDVYLRRIGINEVPLGETQTNPDGDTDAEKGRKAASPIPQTFDERLALSAPRAAATPAQNAYMDIQEQMEPRLAAKMREQLIAFFVDLGAKAETIARRLLDVPKAAKQIEIDPLVADRVLEAMAFDDITPLFAAIFETHYLLTAEESTAVAMETIGLATGIPDPVARAIAATGGTRAGLIDLSQQTKDALFKAIEQGRAEGLGADALARTIRDKIEAGPWSSVDQRAKIIARTETKYAQRISTLEMGKGQGVTQFRVFDARIGLTDAECESLDGIIVDAPTADELAASEHPNGTRDFVPHFG